MNICRQEAIENLVTLLHKTRDAFLYGTRGCGFECRSIMYGALTMGMESSNLLSPKPVIPFPNLNYNCLARNIMAFTSPRWYGLSPGYSSYGSSYPFLVSTDSSRAKKLLRVELGDGRVLGDARISAQTASLEPITNNKRHPSFTGRNGCSN
jgi:hypothetical protein